MTTCPPNAHGSSFGGQFLLRQGGKMGGYGLRGNSGGSFQQKGWVEGIITFFIHCNTKNNKSKNQIFKFIILFQ